MKKIFVLLLFTANTNYITAQTKSNFFKGIYVQWGYNTEWYTKSTIYFKDIVNGVPHNFTIYKATATDRHDLDAIVKKPIEITVPQYNYRVGFYLNDDKTKAIELNFDHTKYILDKNQQVHAKGNIGSTYFDTDTVFIPSDLSFEHTNGANFYHFNYVQQYILKKKNNRILFTAFWKAGAGFLIPKTDITLSGKRVDNKFHIAGYCFSAEGGSRWYFGRKIFLEGAAKTGFVNYTNALALGGGRVNHNFGYFELIATIGYDIKF